MKTKSVHTRLFEEGEDLEQFILEHIPKLKKPAYPGPLVGKIFRKIAPALEQRW